MNQLVDHEAVKKIKELNRANRIVAFEFFDASGRLTDSNRAVVKVTIEFSSGEKFTINNETFNAFQDYEFNIGKDLH